MKATPKNKILAILLYLLSVILSYFGITMLSALFLLSAAVVDFLIAKITYSIIISLNPDPVFKKDVKDIYFLFSLLLFLIGIVSYIGLGIPIYLIFIVKHMITVAFNFVDIFVLAMTFSDGFWVLKILSS